MCDFIVKSVCCKADLSPCRLVALPTPAPSFRPVVIFDSQASLLFNRQQELLSCSETRQHHVSPSPPRSPVFAGRRLYYPAAASGRKLQSRSSSYQ